jgi:uncharacterized membrane protein
MVSSTVDGACNRRFVIRPNRSLTWRQTQLAFLILAAVCLTIASAFALNGFWPVLPFAGIEVLALGVGMYLCVLAGREIEVVSVQGEVVAVEKGRDQPQRRWEFQRAWAQIRLLPPRERWYPTRLVIRSHGKEVQLGGFLNEAERQELAGALCQAISSDNVASGNPPAENAPTV